MNILFDLLVCRDDNKDTFYYIDEMDLHLDTKLQYNFIKEISENWIPENYQLWTASHSLGFIDYARRSETAAIVDLDNLDFDVPQIIEPQTKDNLEVYEIAIPKDIISSILADKKLVVAENTNSKWYNLALGEKNYLFLPAQNNREVFLTIKGDKKKLGLRDRDFLRDDEIASVREIFPNMKILRYYSVENYLYHPDNLCELLNVNFDKAAYIEDITKQKNKRCSTIIGKIAVARQSYVEFKEGVKNDENIDGIIEQLESDNFEVFYPCLNMKDYFNRGMLGKYNLAMKYLVTTGWFKTQIERVLENN